MKGSSYMMKVKKGGEGRKGEKFNVKTRKLSFGRRLEVMEIAGLQTYMYLCASRVHQCVLWRNLLCVML